MPEGAARFVPRQMRGDGRCLHTTSWSDPGHKGLSDELKGERMRLINWWGMQRGHGAEWRVGRIALAMLLAVPRVAASQAPRPLAAPSAATDFAFNRLRQAVELPDGTLLVADRGDDVLYHVRLDGSEPRALLRKGRGPGEYQAVGSLFAIGADSVLFVDGFTGRWIVLRGAQVVGTVSDARATNTTMGSAVLGASRSGRVLGVHGRSWRGKGPRSRETADTLDALLGDVRADGVDSVARLVGAGLSGMTELSATRGGIRRMLMVNPLASADDALLLPDGSIVVARTAPYRVDVRLPSGAWLRGPVIEPRGRTPTRADQCAAITELLSGSEPCEPEKLPGWPSAVPPFLPVRNIAPVPTMLADAQGRVIIARTVDGGATRRRYDVIDRTGRRVQVLELALNQRLLGFGRASVYVVETDDDRLQRITRHPWP